MSSAGGHGTATGPAEVDDSAEFAERVRHAIYARFASSGAASSVDELASALGAEPAVVSAAFDRLATERHVVLDAERRILMAHPFASIPLGFSVMGPDTLWWGGCAWDSFAIPHLVPSAPEVLVATTCPNCGTAHAWTVGRDAPPAGTQVAHFLVPTAHIWDDVVHTCSHQSIFCSTGCVDEWLAAEELEPGYTMSLETLWRLAARWYEGRLDTPYTRRDPQTAAAYFREVGLHGPFWGLD
ncbi:alkylmercury lyase family protein [Herbiconiux sp. CPCC 205763]|uniref:Alkylmercury lyase family protein n=1 Tax=Herbiconiux aconitum TaxID=2970913 RepID=A0ABT2GPZ8_9MICO|nr:alkylmercury lyase family protein [Herbiconiux aconitum]MCS5718300.1 alkylmercury lyase family protein [Herbiconiux aconitum]